MNTAKQWVPWELVVFKDIRILKAALANVAQLVGHHPIKQKVAGSIPGQGKSLGGRPGPRLGTCARSNRLMFLSHVDISLTLFLPPFPTL